MTGNIFINKVEASGIIAFDLIDYKPDIEIIEFDIKDYLYMEMIVKEKEFRNSMSQIDFTYFKGKAVGIVCSADAIIPPWVYMVLAEKFHDNAVYFDFKDITSIEEDLWKENLLKADVSSFTGHKVVVRARPDIPPALYMLATSRLKLLVKVLMYGEIGMPKVIFKN
ncbi:hypothetical protein ATE49_03295 [Elizabethkingia miricola]|uniref:Uncharacterized protein DUF2480 n=1 Tax=Elizabethkingia miricola TaxID=172045 RepID=A0ABY3NCW3_ELIMR|nr:MULTISPECIES: DUF2480 family protein [Elizabethkingia]OBS12856.1 hypothetical protein ATE49_03295 [Elizabethkingia miricola]TYO88950.1 uncharacterized protein DUF2480 [Elizabethkingia miricola]